MDKEQNWNPKLAIEATWFMLQGSLKAQRLVASNTKEEGKGGTKIERPGESLGSRTFHDPSPTLHN